jgi:hypothetical protein
MKILLLGIVSILLIIVGLIYAFIHIMKLTQRECKHCGQKRAMIDTYCEHCGEE